MNKYTAINIGPIVSTLMMSKHPRELWSASYMFSHLMRCIIDSIPTNNDIVSPGRLKDIEDKDRLYTTIGLYPDRVFIKGDIDVEAIKQTAFEKFEKGTNIFKESTDEFFNIMSASVEASTEHEAIQKLNQYLDYLELNNRTPNPKVVKEIFKILIQDQQTSPLFNIAGFTDGEFPIETLAEIATKELAYLNEKKWKEARILELFVEGVKRRIKCADSEFEYNFYEKINHDFKDHIKSHHKYICIVQADGDGMGSIVSNLKDGQIKDLSLELLKFGSAACLEIKKYGGMPIYAGGDDLLFIAPVISASQDEKNKKVTIFDLISKIDKQYESVVNEVNKYNPEKDGKRLRTSMSYGISITYYKFPLYEALGNARNLLFNNAKNVEGKNAIAWKLQKHSGSTFSGQFSKNMVENSIYAAIQNVINNSNINESMVSAVAHKIRSNESLLGLCLSDKENMDIRVNNFFAKYMDDDGKNLYLEAVRNLIKSVSKSTIDMTELTKIVYSVLRTAKFIKGEDVKSE